MAVRTIQNSIGKIKLDTVGKQKIIYKIIYKICKKGRGRKSPHGSMYRNNIGIKFQETKEKEAGISN